MPTLYAISDDIAALGALLEETGGELTPENEAAFVAFEAEITSNLNGKVDGYCALIAEIDARAAARVRNARVGRGGRASAGCRRRRANQLWGLPAAFW